MNKTPLIAGLLGLLAATAQAADVPTLTCEQLREQIKAVTGIVSTVNTDLLQKLSLRAECRFSSAEVYRAAYGDLPLPKPDTYPSHDSHQDDD